MVVLRSRFSAMLDDHIKSMLQVPTALWYRSLNHSWDEISNVLRRAAPASDTLSTRGNDPDFYQLSSQLRSVASFHHVLFTSLRFSSRCSAVCCVHGSQHVRFPIILESFNYRGGI